MAVLNAIATLTLVAAPAPVSSDLYLYEQVPVPTSQLLQAGPGYADLQTQWPVSQDAARTITATSAGCFVDDFYNRVHLSIDELELGNVVSEQVFEVVLWNAWFVPQTVVAVAGEEDGLVLSGQYVPPFTLPPLGEMTETVSVSPFGSTVLDADLSWEFDNGESPSLHLTATRIIAWQWQPDWTQGVTETLSWLTDVLRSESNAEQRRALRVTPRREMAANILVNGTQRQAFDLAMFGWASRIWAVPVWPDVQTLHTAVALGDLRIPCATTDLDFYEGGLVMLQHGDRVEVGEVDSLDAGGLDTVRELQQSWPVGTRIYPARPGQLVASPELSRRGESVYRTDIQMEFMDASSWPSLQGGALPVYRGVFVLDTAPDESVDLTRSYEHLQSSLDSRVAIPLRTDIAGAPIPMTGWRDLLDGRSARAEFRSLLYSLKGQQGAVWVPTHADDLQVVSIVLGDSLSMDVANVGYSRFAKARPGRRDVRIELTSGQVFYRRITGASELSEDVERVGLDAVLGVQVEPSEIRRISWMTLSRLAADRVEIQHMTDSEGLARSALVFRGVRDDEF